MNRRIFVSTLTLTQPGEWETLINSGMGVEIFAEGPEWRDFDEGISLAKAYLRHHKGPRSLHAPFYDLNLASENYSSLRELSFRILQHALERAPELECEYMVIHPHSGSSHVFERFRTKQWIKVALNHLAGKARQVGVKLAIENVGYGPAQLFDAREFVELIYEIDGVVGLLDVGHAHLNGWDIPEVIGQLGEKLVALHLHDNWGQADEHLPVGRGSIDFRPIWEALAEAPARPALVLEYYKVPVQETLNDANYLQKIFGEPPMKTGALSTNHGKQKAILGEVVYEGRQPLHEP